MPVVPNRTEVIYQREKQEEYTEGNLNSLSKFPKRIFLLEIMFCVSMPSGCTFSYMDCEKITAGQERLTCRLTCKAAWGTPSKIQPCSEGHMDAFDIVGRHIRIVCAPQIFDRHGVTTNASVLAQRN